MTSKEFKIGLAGFGVVGSGLCRLLKDNADIIHRRTGKKIVIKTILVKDPAKKRDTPLPEGARLTSNPEELFRDPDIEAVVELIGGVEQAGKLVSAALECGKHVITANKALLAEDGLKLLKLAARQNRILRYEASVAGAVPVVSALKESMNGNRVFSLTGILNGTSNYILSEMTASNLDFATALAQAQGLGYAEADPSLDIDGGDAAHKLVILIRLAFGLNYPLSSLKVRGIRNLSALDISLAREFGYRIKLLGQVQATRDCKGQECLAAGIFPALVHESYLLASVNGSYNALLIGANASGPLFFHGKGAGSLPTAGAVLADLVAVARNEAPNNSGFAEPEMPEACLMPADEWPACYYARVMVNDSPGVLRDISGCMAAENISVAQMIQKSGQGKSSVPLVFMTHQTCDKAMLGAMEKAKNLGLLKEKPVWFRVLEKEEMSWADM